MDLNELERQLTQIASRSAILKAACILAASPLHNASDYMFMGADEVLCRPDETIANRAERFGYMQYCCCRDLGIHIDRLNLKDCIRWICNDNEDEEDCVSFEDVVSQIG